MSFYLDTWYRWVSTHQREFQDSSSHCIGVPILLFHRSAALLDSDSDDPRFEDAKRMEHETRQNYVQVPGAWIASYPFITKPSEYNKAEQITTALSVRSATSIPSEFQTSVTRQQRHSCLRQLCRIFLKPPESTGSQWFSPWCYKFWKEFIGTHCSQLSVGASRDVLLWLMNSVTQIHQPRPTLSVSVLGYLAQLTWATLKVKSPGIMVTFPEMNNTSTRWYNWKSMNIIEHQVWDLPFSKLSMPASAAHQLAVSSSVNPGFIKVDRGSCEIDMRQSS